ncbi:sugar porter family MFS transporter [Rhodococcus erythropolis]|jgi:SP family sugar:H+ symporter-like MFS transporter|uniref:sugar porter family MFS transporter n=1 Tax=Rhodococcus erythropolis TaxID=1833 RepID=UPI0009BF3A79|nr:sugar porter family MFS transporter [Rhodococcus erythropolis]
MIVVNVLRILQARHIKSAPHSSENSMSVPSNDDLAPSSHAAVEPADETASHGSYRTVSLIAAAGAIGGFLFGFDTAVINGAVDSIEVSFGLTPVGIGVVVAITLFGAAGGALCAGWLADRVGRRKVMATAAIIFLVAALGCGVSNSFWDLALWRLTTGLGVGFATVIGPLYIAEIAPAQLRGRLAALQQLAIVLGILLALVSDSTIAHALGGADAHTFAGLPAWRWMFLAGVIPAVVYGSLVIVIPESPRYLVACGRKEEARKVFSRLHAITLAQASDVVDRVEASLHGAGASARFADVLSRRTGLVPVVWVGVGLASLQALVGIDVIFYYSTSLWKSVGFDESSSFGLSVLSAAVNVLATVVAVALIDRIGRRLLLLVGSASMFVSLILVTVGFSTASQGGGELELSGIWGPLTLVGANMFVLAFAISWGPAVWVLLGEMFPNNIRGIAFSIAASANWVSGVLLNLTFPSLRTWSLPGSYAIYAVMAALSWCLVYRYVSETKGLELEEIHEK